MAHLLMHTQLASNVAWWLKTICSLFADLLIKIKRKKKHDYNNVLRKVPEWGWSFTGRVVQSLPDQREHFSKQTGMLEN